MGIGRRRRIVLLVAIATLGFGSGACGTTSPGSPSVAATPAPSGAPVSARPNDIPQPPTGPVTLTGVGATLPAPLYQVWFDRFSGTYANVSISYAPRGSLAGITAATTSAATFG